MMRIGKFTDFYRDVTKAGTKIPQEKYLKVGHYPVIDQGRQAIVGRWDSDDGICKEIPAIIFGDHTRAIKYIEEPFFIGADGVKILRPVNVQDNPKYLYYALQAARIPNLGYSRHFKALKELDFHVCSIEKQDEIVRILEKIDYLIEQCHEEDSCLNQIVKSRFVELFGDPAMNTKGWEIEKAEKHIDLLSGFPFDSSHYTECGIKICGGLIIMPQRIDWDSCKYWSSIEGFEEYTLRENDIVMALDRPWISEGFKVAMVDADELPALLIQRTARIRAVDINQHYLMYCFILGGFDNHCNVTGSLVPHISAKDIRSFPIMLPSIELQEQFSTFVEQTNKSKYYSQKFLTLCRLAVNTYEQEWMKCQTLNF